MRKWVDSLIARGKLASTGEPLTVTGYSLGGHLATAFNTLYPATSKATYTFNGAGVGRAKWHCLSDLRDEPLQVDA